MPVDSHVSVDSQTLHPTQRAFLLNEVFPTDLESSSLDAHGNGCSLGMPEKACLLDSTSKDSLRSQRIQTDIATCFKLLIDQQL